jgi:oligoendopeptidase F
MTVPAVDPGKEFPRRFVPADADAGRWEEIEQPGEALIRRPPQSLEGLVRCLEDASELAGWVAEEGSRRYIAMTSQTDDPERERAYLSFVREIGPRWRALAHRLDRAYLEHPHRRVLPPQYRVFDRRIENRVTLYRDENLALQVTETELGQQYQKLRGAMTVLFRGQEYTLEQLGPFLEDPDRSVREEAWVLSAERLLRDRDELEGLFDRLREIRLQIARNAGFASYRDYAWRARERFDYTPEDCRRFHEAVEACFVPLLVQVADERRRLLGVETFRPWDVGVDPLGRLPLPTFERPDELLERCEAVFRRVHPDLAAQFRFMRDRGLLDVERRKGKAPGGYQQTLHERRWPFIFLNVSPSQDVETILHEGGHAFHALAAREEPLLAYRSAPLEFAEVASMGMELLSAPHLDAIYPAAEDARRAVRTLLDGILVPKGMPWIATIDAFQHWLYTHPEHTAAERRDAWVRTYRRFNPAVDWSGHDDTLAYAWHRQLHLFLLPFYYIEYGVAQLGALQLWKASKDDYQGTVAKYRTALSLGASRTLPELFESAGLRFGFDQDLMAPLAHALAEALSSDLKYK